MAFLNDHYLKLKAGYLFPEIARRVNTYAAENPSTAKNIIRCGIGDVTEPLPAAVREAMHHAVDENDYRGRGLSVTDDEIFVSDGSKCDCGNILDIFGHQNRIAVMDPVYPVYVDTNVMAGHTGDADTTGAYSGLVYLPCNEANGFVPALPKEKVDLIYLCYPNNPTGATATREQLTGWVEYALKAEAIILFDAAYEAYITHPGIPHSIYEIPRARQCAIEFRSFSKNGGFTGVRCGFTVLPKELQATTRSGEKRPLHPLWHRRFSTKFNSVSYPVQRGAEALYSKAGQEQIRSLIDHYLANARLLATALQKTGLSVYGGINAPYIWVKAPSGFGSWAVFEKILHEIQVVITPGAGFGAQGEGFFRVSAFNSRENAEAVAERFQKVKW